MWVNPDVSTFAFSLAVTSSGVPAMQNRFCINQKIQPGHDA